MMNKGYWQRQAGSANEVIQPCTRRKKLHLILYTESTFVVVVKFKIPSTKQVLNLLLLGLETQDQLFSSKYLS
jgi:hypothetical protein